MAAYGMAAFAAGLEEEQDTIHNGRPDSLEEAQTAVLQTGSTGQQPVPRDPPPSVANAIHSTVREPTPDVISSWATLQQMATWATV